MRITADNIPVSPHEAIWEVVFRYINAEVSWAEAEQKESLRVPEQYHIWKYLSNCEAKCREVNKRNYPGIEKI